MESKFNLIDEPWLPCVQRDGQPVMLGLYDALARAHTLRELQGEIPLATAALHRLLLAILHRNFGPRNQSEWSRLWGAGRWDEAALRAYFDRWRDRFNLFDSQHPFYQIAAPDSSRESPNRLSLTHGFNSTLFEHETAAENFAVPAARAAQWLVTMQAAGIGTGPPSDPYPAGPLVNSLLVLAQGDNLFETMAFNLIEYDARRGKPIPGPSRGEDRPIWEHDDNPYPPSPKKFYRPGYLGYLTFLVRRIRLYPILENGALYVRECTVAQGARWDNQSIEDPMKVYVKPADEKRKDQGWFPLRLREDRALWRDASALFQLRSRASGAPTGRPPLAFEWLARHVEAGDIERARIYSYVTLGLCNDKARLDFFRHERMPLPLAYFAGESEALEEKLRDALQAAEAAASVLRNAGRDLAGWIVSPADKKKASRDGVKLVFAQLNIERRYWSRLEVPFQHFLRGLPQDAQAAWKTWTSTLKSTARRAFEEAAEGVEDPLRGLKAATLARGTLEHGLAAALGPSGQDKDTGA
jgi:CRISPR system Cascade subunit CasA